MAQSTVMLTTSAAAERLGVIPRRVCAMIETGRLPATRQGRAWQIDPKDLERVKNRKPGRPPAMRRLVLTPTTVTHL